MLGVQGLCVVCELQRSRNICKILSHSAPITAQVINMNREALSFSPAKTPPTVNITIKPSFRSQAVHLSALLMVWRDYKPRDGCTLGRAQHGFGLLIWRINGISCLWWTIFKIHRDPFENFDTGNSVLVVQAFCANLRNLHILTHRVFQIGSEFISFSYMSRMNTSVSTGSNKQTLKTEPDILKTQRREF